MTLCTLPCFVQYPSPRARVTAQQGSPSFPSLIEASPSLGDDDDQRQAIPRGQPSSSPVAPRRSDPGCRPQHPRTPAPPPPPPPSPSPTSSAPTAPLLPFARSINTAAATTVLAPLNSAVDALPRKPWEDPREIDALGDAAYDGSPDAQKRADANLRRFVEAHLVPESPWPEGRRAQNMAGRELWWEARPGGERVIMPDGVEVDRVASRVANGEVWFLNGVLGQTPPKSS
ncbi:hypothetical protein HIM_06862 [Hirsutella minnesotensis 3608]|uniref:FAS1 domain-containing protein n=1 Tax=Hirsutella minnesotensis 3608 TaxID=1043627 RepID=A0A0F8A4K6_9HYPO|nr:hypothetical protein HIM_06862 [Hirsutella minnesotensis 3608]